MKVPSHEYEATVRFYREVLGLPELTGPGETDSVRFEFGDKVLWIDNVGTLSQAETWLEIVTDDVASAAAHFERHGCIRRDEIEPLPNGFHGFWLASPANIIHLVSAANA